MTLYIKYILKKDVNFDESSRTFVNVSAPAVKLHYPDIHIWLKEFFIQSIYYTKKLLTDAFHERFDFKLYFIWSSFISKELLHAINIYILQLKFWNIKINIRFEIWTFT